MLSVGLMGVGRPDFYSARVFASGALLGLCLNAGAMLVESPVFWLLRVTRAWPLSQRVLLSALSYFAGGCLGATVAWFLSTHLGLGRYGIDSLQLSDLSVFGFLAAAVGLGFFVVQFLRRRLAESIERIKEQEHAERELEVARALQRRIMPPGSIRTGSYRIEARNLPARVVAGDFYSVFPLPDGDIGLAVGDVLGKGMAASLRMASVFSMLPLIAAERSVAATLCELNRRLFEELSWREFVALGYARFDPRSGSFEAANAGLPDFYCVRPEAGPDPRLVAEVSIEVLALDDPRLPLGVRPEVDYQSVSSELLPLGALVMLSDGLPELVGEGGDPLGYERLGELLSQWNTDPAMYLDSLLENAGARRGEPDDDVTVLVAQWLGSGKVSG